MTDTEMRCRLEERSKALESRFEKKFEKSIINGQACFVRPDGSFFDLDYIVPFGALVIEFAENRHEVELNRLEDGDLYYLEDMDEETMFQSMLEEIEG